MSVLLLFRVGDCHRVHLRSDGPPVSIFNVRLATPGIVAKELGHITFDEMPFFW